MAKHPPLNSASWHNVYADDEIKVYQDGNDDIFFKVIIKGSRPKYFYNETAWSDVPRHIVDETGNLKYWNILN